MSEESQEKKAGNKNVPAKQTPIPPATTPTEQVSQLPSERFTHAVMAEFAANAGGLAVSVTDFERKLCQNYFVKLDMTLKAAEAKRLEKKEQDRDPVAIEWKSINMPKLAVDVMAFSKVGLDPVQPNHINMVPYKNKTTGKYDIQFTMGYRGCEIKATKYGLSVPNDVVVELIYATDTFRVVKKDINNPVETYEFAVSNPFSRGELLGGFYYHSFTDNPEKNKIRVLSKADIDKRKPKYASTEFWGGEKDEWVDGRKTGKKVQVDGWYDEMAYKTVYRAAYDSITIDSKKIDTAINLAIEQERENNFNSMSEGEAPASKPLAFGVPAAEAKTTLQLGENAENTGTIVLEPKTKEKVKAADKKDASQAGPGFE